jgi:hypothetical protein
VEARVKPGKLFITALLLCIVCGEEVVAAVTYVPGTAIRVCDVDVEEQEAKIATSPPWRISTGMGLNLMSQGYQQDSDESRKQQITMDIGGVYLEGRFSPVRRLLVDVKGHLGKEGSSINDSTTGSGEKVSAYILESLVAYQLVSQTHLRYENDGDPFIKDGCNRSYTGENYKTHNIGVQPYRYSGREDINGLFFVYQYENLTVTGKPRFQRLTLTARAGKIELLGTGAGIKLGGAVNLFEIDYGLEFDVGIDVFEGVDDSADVLLNFGIGVNYF